jgi:hypothetical protein
VPIHPRDLDAGRRDARRRRHPLLSKLDTLIRRVLLEPAFPRLLIVPPDGETVHRVLVPLDEELVAELTPEDLLDLEGSVGF